MPTIQVVVLAAMFLLISHLSGGLEAYLDPGSGSIALQFILGALVATLAGVKLYWQRMKAFLRGAGTTAADQDVATEDR